MHRNTINIIALVIVVIIGIALWITLENRRTGQNGGDTQVACTMDAKMCPDGSAVGRTGSNCEFAECPTPVGDDIQAHIDSKANLIMVESPKRDTVVSSPITITGEARGYWFFEASFPITIVNWNGLIIGEGIATADGEWMTEDFVPFSATITYTLPADTPYRRGAIIFKKDNPSGLPENDNALEIPIQFE